MLTRIDSVDYGGPGMPLNTLLIFYLNRYILFKIYKINANST